MGKTGCALGIGLAALPACLLWTEPALANPDDVVLLPTVTRCCAGRGELRRPDPADDPRGVELARQLDSILGEAAQDLGLTLDVSERISVEPAELTEAALLARAADCWVVSPRLQVEGQSVSLRIVAVAPGSQVLLVRVEHTTLDQLEIRAMVAMRDLVVAGRGVPDEQQAAAAATSEAERTVVAPARSEGRAVLALNGAALGGYAGLSLQRASGSNDARLLYPLMALGTGVGLGASVIAASEWDVGLGDAWFLSAGMWWPAASGLLLSDHYDVEPVEDRYVYGLGGALAGLTLATVAVSHGVVSPGSATLAHSGGAWGTVLGGLVQLYYQGETELSPTGGMGYGAGLGVLTAGIIATQLRPKPARVLLIDLMAGLGGLTGAAVASPAIFGEERSHAENRIWLASIAGGVLAGATVGFFVTEPAGQASQSAWQWAALPFAGVIATGVDPTDGPVLGGGLRGVW